MPFSLSSFSFFFFISPTRHFTSTYISKLPPVEALLLFSTLLPVVSSSPSTEPSPISLPALLRSQQAHFFTSSLRWCRGGCLTCFASPRLNTKQILSFTIPNLDPPLVLLSPYHIILLIFFIIRGVDLPLWTNCGSQVSARLDDRKTCSSSRSLRPLLTFVL